MKFNAWIGILGWAVASVSGAADLSLAVGESKVLSVGNASKVAIGNPAVADVTVVSDVEVLVTGRSPGSTNLLFVSPSGRRMTRTVIVSPHRLKKSMVELAVEILEVDTGSSLKAGLSWGSTDGAAYLPQGAVWREADPPASLKLGTLQRDSVAASVQLLIERGKARVLAKPKLLAVSGEEASFLAGGEVPYVLENSLGNSKVEWKPYGVKLTMKPAVDAEGNVQASLRAEVSGLDLQNGAPLGTSGNLVPALKTRWSETTVYMKSGSTLVIAGLIQENAQKVTVGVPLVSELPLLGELFRSTRYDRRQTELVVFVTPTLVGSPGAEL